MPVTATARLRWHGLNAACAIARASELQAEGDRRAVLGAGAFDHRSAHARGTVHHGAKALRPGEQAGGRLRGGAARVQRPADAAAVAHAATATATDSTEERRLAARAIRAAHTRLPAPATRATARRCGDWHATARRTRPRRAAPRRRTHRRRHCRACAGGDAPARPAGAPRARYRARSRW